MNNPDKQRFSFLKSSLVKNGSWGIASNILQMVMICVFFAIVARKYPPAEFARFLISNTVYQIIAAFSSMGLGQWFIRQYLIEDNKLALTGKFLKTQIGLGLVFYVVNLIAAYLIYSDLQIRLLCIILGTNIVFDNLINAIRSLNVAENEQRKTALILVIDGLLKLLVGCLLFVHPFSVIVLSALMIAVRVLTLSFFIKVGSSNSITPKLLWTARVSIDDLKQLIVKNWQFIVIGSISIIYWKIANIIISKTLSLSNVADYEIAFRIFSVILILPIVATTTIYPQFIKSYNASDVNNLKKLYKNVSYLYSVFAIISFVFIYFFADLIVPFAFGKGYPGAILCLQQMFFTFLILPTVLLQANLIVAIGLEKLDMVFNIISLVVNVLCCMVGLYFVKELSMVNYAVLISFVVFHISQDILLIRKKLMTAVHCIMFYTAKGFTAVVCIHFKGKINPYLFFTLFAGMLAGVTAALFLKNRNLIAQPKVNTFKNTI